jgi:LysM repeat protein
MVKGFDMKFRGVLVSCALMAMALLSGCFAEDVHRSGDNVAYYIAPEIASNGASARKKPIQPKAAPEKVATLEVPVVQQQKSRGEVERVQNYGGGTKYDLYTVQRGDTIYSVSRKCGVPPWAIMDLNGLDRNSTLMAGEVIKVKFGKHFDRTAGGMPIGAIKTAIYLVQAGDSLAKVARSHGISIKELKNINDLQSDVLLVGQKLNVPAVSRAKVGSPKKVASSGPMDRGDEDGCYTVKEGESVYVIAKRFGVRRADLIKANNLSDPNMLAVGQRLIIPLEQQAAATATPKAPATTVRARSNRALSDSSMYTIQNGDTVAKIAAELGVAQEELMELNSLDRSSALQAGKKLLVPQKKPTMAEQKHVVEQKPVEQSKPQASDEDFFDTFEEIPVIELND